MRTLRAYLVLALAGATFALCTLNWAFAMVDTDPGSRAWAGLFACLGNLTAAALVIWVDIRDRLFTIEWNQRRLEAPRPEETGGGVYEAR